MKRTTLWIAIGIAVVAVTVIAARADLRGGHGWCGRGWHRGGPLGYVAHELNLSDTQKAQIKSIWQAERPTISSLVRELSAENKEMDTTTATGSLEESKVQEIASRQGTTVAKLLVEKEQLKSKIYSTVLNPEQRTKADELQKHWHSRLDGIADRIERGDNNSLNH